MDETGLVPGPHGCLLGADADLTRRRPARAEPAHGQARVVASTSALEQNEDMLALPRVDR
jgi:hypothetical protein